MVLESLVGAKQAEKSPKYAFLLGFLYASVAVFLSLWIFRSDASLVLVFLIVFASLPLIYQTLKIEAFKDIEADGSKSLIPIHIDALRVFMYLFLGFVLALSLWYVVLPSTVVYEIFASQLATIKGINSPSTVGHITAWNFLSVIVMNNLRVLIFCILFSFFFGAGAIFILTWNASVVSVAIGNFVRMNIYQYTEAIGLMKIAGYFHIFSLGLIRYLMHGVFEILGYFIGGLAGGLISFAMINNKFEGETFRKIVKDSVDLIILGILVIIMAGLIEVFITPIFF